MIVAVYANPVVDGEPRVFPAQEGGGELLCDQRLGEQELDDGTAEGFGELRGVVDGKEEEATIGGEPSFQNDGVPVGVRAKAITGRGRCA